METDDKVQDFFRKNAENIPEREPDFGHFERMQQRIAAAHDQRKGRSFKIGYWAVAASLLLLILAGAIYSALLSTPNSEDPSANQTIVSEDSLLKAQKAEYADIEMYYNMQIDKKLESVESSLLKDSTSLDELITALDGLELQYLQLKKEIQMGVFSEQLTKRMIQNYQLRLELLNRVSTQLDKNLKTQTHEIKNS